MGRGKKYGRDGCKVRVGSGCCTDMPSCDVSISCGGCGSCPACSSFSCSDGGCGKKKKKGCCGWDDSSSSLGKFSLPYKDMECSADFNTDYDGDSMRTDTTGGGDDYDSSCTDANSDVGFSEDFTFGCHRKKRREKRAKNHGRGAAIDDPPHAGRGLGHRYGYRGGDFQHRDGHYDHFYDGRSRFRLDNEDPAVSADFRGYGNRNHAYYHGGFDRDHGRFYRHGHDDPPHDGHDDREKRGSAWMWHYHAARRHFDAWMPLWRQHRESLFSLHRIHRGKSQVLDGWFDLFKRCSDKFESAFFSFGAIRIANESDYGWCQRFVSCHRSFVGVAVLFKRMGKILRALKHNSKDATVLSVCVEVSHHYAPLFRSAPKWLSSVFYLGKYAHRHVAMEHRV